MLSIFWKNKFKIFVGLLIVLIIPLWSLKAQQDNLVNQAIQTETNEIDDLKEQIQQKQQEIEKLQKEAEQYRASLNESSSMAKTLNAEISRINKKIKSLEYEININQKKIEEAQLKIRDLNNNIDQTENTIEENKKILAELVQTLNELDNQNNLVVLLKINNLSDYFSQLAYVENLQAKLIEKTTFLAKLNETLNESLNQSEELKRQYENFQKDLAAQKAITSDIQEEKDQLLKETKNREATYQSLLNETIRKQQEVEKEIEKLEAELRAKTDYSTLPTGKFFIWPIANGYLTQGYGTVPLGSDTRKFYTFHNGIDIGSKSGIGAPILAAADGKVTAIGNDGKYAYGKWIAIDHNNGFITLYGHLSLISVSVGQNVKQGERIGYMGQTGLATGPHLHFTVYTKESFRTENRWYGLLPFGAAVNPLDYTVR